MFFKLAQVLHLFKFTGLRIDSLKSSEVSVIGSRAVSRNLGQSLSEFRPKRAAVGCHQPPALRPPPFRNNLIHSSSCDFKMQQVSLEHLLVLKNILMLSRIRTHGLRFPSMTIIIGLIMAGWPSSLKIGDLEGKKTWWF